ncbi:hypothetical protein [Shimazuella soli]|nr:hypothetical protein [Shimazuella soli]
MINQYLVYSFKKLSRLVLLEEMKKLLTSLARPKRTAGKYFIERNAVSV